MRDILTSLLAFMPGSRARAGELVKYIPFKKDGKLIDVGCGSGSFLLTMKKLGWTCVGLEPDPNAVNSGLEAGLDIKEGLPSDISRLKEEWDAITMSHVIEHVQSPPKVLRDLCSSLQSEGRLVSISPNPESSLAKAFKRDWIHLHPPHHLVIPSVQGYRTMAKQLNMQCYLYTTNRFATGTFRNSISNRLHGSIKGKRHWRTGKVWRIFFANILKLFNPLSGDEIVCILSKVPLNS
jgi:ubiquinone/menaquinone biosynthesis C-methylase UbiE